MMPSAQHSDSVIAALVEARSQSLKAASEARNVEELMTWYSADAVLQDKARDKSVVGIDELRKYYSDAYTAIPTFRIVKATSTAPTVDFVAAEMTCEGVAAFDMPAGNVMAGDTLSMIGVSLFWWRWEGPGESRAMFGDPKCDGFIDVVEKVIPMLLGTWPEDPKSKTIGGLSGGNPKVSSETLFPLMTKVGMAKEEATECAARLRSEMDGGIVHA